MRPTHTTYRRRSAAARLGSLWLGLGALLVSLSTSPARAEWAVDAFFGLPFPLEGNTEADGPAASNFIADADVDQDVAFGIRIGHYFSIAQYFDLGLSIDASGILGELGAADFNIVPVTGAVTGRIPLMVDNNFTHGRLQPYIGVGPSFVWSDVNQNDFADSAVDIGADTRIGLNYMIIPNFGVYAEYRFLYFKGDYSDRTELTGLYGHVEVKSYTHIPTVGIAWRFGNAAPPPPPPPPVVVAPPPLPPPTKRKIVLRGVQFDTDRADIRSDARVIVDQAAKTLVGEGNVNVVVAGHTDSRGSEEYNLALSQRRADSVRDYLISQGVAAERLTVEAYGESKPVASNDTEEGRDQNRRVELDIRD